MRYKRKSRNEILHIFETIRKCIEKEMSCSTIAAYVGIPTNSVTVYYEMIKAGLAPPPPPLPTPTPPPLPPPLPLLPLTGPIACSIQVTRVKREIEVRNSTKPFSMFDNEPQRGQQQSRSWRRVDSM
jgi:hypothetical protein